MSDQMREGGRWRLNSFPTEYAVTRDQYEPPTSPMIQIHTDSRVSSEIHTEGHDEAPTWKDSANCLGVDPDLFFPERGEPTKHAKAVCRGCDVIDECREYALTNGEKHGIWGGLSERERRRIRRLRALDAAS